MQPSSDASNEVTDPHLASVFVRRIEKLLPPVTPSTDALTRDSAVLLVTTMSVGFLCLIGFSISQYLSGLYSTASVSAVVGLGVALLLVWFLRGGSQRYISHTFMISGFLGLIAGAMTSGGILSFTLPTLMLYPLFAFVLLGIRSALWWVVAAAVTVCILYLLHQLGLRIPYQLDNEGVPGQVLGNLLVMATFGAGLVVWHYIADRRHKAALNHASRLAEAANEAKSRFLANMSHELRTPMHSVIGLTELALERQQLDSTDYTAMTTVLRSAQTMVRLLDDLLDLSRIEAGALPLRRMNVDPRTVVEDVFDLLRGRASSKAVSLHLQIAPDVASGISDGVRLYQVLVNLVGNAIKFTSEGAVTVRCSRAGDTVLFEVQDTGTGLPSQELDRIFLPFVQLDSSSTRTHGGSGLGLTISRHLVESLGGELTVSSSKGVGSSFRFSISLPLSDSVSSTQRNVLPRPSTENKLRVLVADDNEINREVVRCQLEILQVDVILVEDGLAALEEMNRDVFDLVLMDLHMPKLDGLDATRRAREQGYTGPIVAMTASALASDREACERAGMTSFIVKPASLDMLSTVLNQ